METASNRMSLGTVSAWSPSLANAQAFSGRAASYSGWGDVLSFVIPVVTFVRIALTGQLILSDVLALVAFPFVYAKYGKRLRESWVVITLGLCGVWFVSQVVSDITNHSVPNDYLRGWAKISFTMVHFMVIVLLIRNSRRRLVLYGMGWAVGHAAKYYVVDQASVDFWKFGFSLPASLVVCLVAGNFGRKQRGLAALLILALASVHLYLGFRNMAAICVVSAVYSQFRLSNIKLGRAQLALSGAVVALAMWGLSATYSYGALNHWFGDEAYKKYLIQSEGEGGILLGGRSEILAAWHAITDSPILGHGSWAKDPQYAAWVDERRAELGYQRVGHMELDGLIPSHSHLFGAWVESGIAGACFWCWVLCLVFRSLSKSSGREPEFTFCVFIGTALFWDVLFSPFGANVRFTAAYSIYTMIFLHRHTMLARMSNCHVQGVHRHNLVQSGPLPRTCY